MNKFHSNILLLSSFFLVSAANAQENDRNADLAAGEHLAQTVCAACHFVSPGQAQHPVLQAPSFLQIANKPGESAESLRAFIQTTHDSIKSPLTMPSMMLSDKETNEVVFYILSLKKPQ